MLNKAKDDPVRKSMKQKKRIIKAPLAAGQVWRMEDATYHIKEVGKRLVHYKRSFTGKNIRVPVSLTSRETLEKHLKANRAVLLPEK